MGMFKNRTAIEQAPGTAPAPSARAGAPSAGEELLEARLREAVAGGKFHLHYQPLVAVDTGNVAGVEALLRWDTSFVAGLGRHTEDDAVVAGIITLAHALGMRTIAEGVETAAQLDRLQGLGCDLAQGFYIKEPVEAAAVGRLLHETAATAA
jgi:EAL domain-containing protein (putative c-di-GMP-specific phosphodiesterase class I)